MKCFYHTDMDGHCAGAIVYEFFAGEGEYKSIDYDQPFPFEEINKDELVVIVDFSLQKEGDFEKLLAITSNVTWIDHHKTAIEKHQHLSEAIRGIRRDNISACELAWEYFFSPSPIPKVVELLGDYDTWTFKYGENTNYLQAGIRLYETHPCASEWDKWLDPDYEPIDEINAGKIALKYRNSYYASLIKSLSFPTTFEGHKAIACNAGCVSSELFDTVEEDYDIMMPFKFNGKIWTVSLYTKKEIDVSELAKKYGGGGHRKASGFQCTTLPFRSVQQ